MFAVEGDEQERGIRLHKFMAQAGVASRRACEALIRSGRVRVNGEPVSEMGVRVRPGVDRVEVDGRALKAAEDKLYVMLNKPRGYVTTVSDPEGRRTVLDLLPPMPVRLYPVGRLDFDTEGLLLLTNDGELTHALTHPRREVAKVYLADVEGRPSPEALDRLRRGVRLEDGVTAPVLVKVGPFRDGQTQLTLTIREGRNRQIRRMLEAVGHPVTFLKRIRFGPLSLSGVKLGQWRPLTAEEVEKLQAAVKAASRPRPSRGASRKA